MRSHGDRIWPRAAVAIITGEGKAFCAGWDLGVLRGLAQQTADQNRNEARRMAQIFHRLWSFPKPLIAAVNGADARGRLRCHGNAVRFYDRGGRCQVRIHRSARRDSFPRWLLDVPGATGRARQGGARSIAHRRRIVDAAEALELGLVTRVVPAGRAMEAARELAATLLENSSASMEATKRLLVRQEEGLVDWRTEAALDESVAIRSTPDFRERRARGVSGKAQTALVKRLLTSRGKSRE